MALGTICGLAFQFLTRCLGFVCAGMPLMLCGHFFLKLSHAPEYQDASYVSSISVGALGGVLMTVPMLVVEWMIKHLSSCSLPSLRLKTTDNESVESSQQTAVANDGLPFSIWGGIFGVLATIGSVVGLGAGTGYFGSAILGATGHDTLDTLAATRAGAVGAAILGPGALVLVLLLSLCCGGSVVALLMCVSPENEKSAKAEKAPETKV